MEVFKKKLRAELPKLYLDSERRFLAYLRSNALRNGQWDKDLVKNLVFDYNCPLTIPRGREEVGLFVDFICLGLDNEVRETLLTNFNEVLSEVIFDIYKDKVDVKRFKSKSRFKRQKQR